jgi:glutathione peroxidase
MTVSVTLTDVNVKSIEGAEGTLAPYADKAILIVNVASKCGLTPQYEGLERLQKRFGDQGFTVLGFPSNQFRGQEPGTNAEIAEFCSATYGVTFPLFEKVDVNGEDAHPLYAALTTVPDANGDAGDVAWNFEKFLISPTGEVVGRFRPKTDPESDEVVSAIESVLPQK